VRELVVDVLSDPATRQTASEKLRAVLGQTKTVVTGLEFVARVNKEIGLGSGDMPRGVTIIFQSNVRPEKLLAAKDRALPLE
jgi:hypothetical protein